MQCLLAKNPSMVLSLVISFLIDRDLKSTSQPILPRKQLANGQLLARVSGWYLGVGVADGVHHGRERVDASDVEILAPDFERVDVENVCESNPSASKSLGAIVSKLSFFPEAASDSIYPKCFYLAYGIRC